MIENKRISKYGNYTIIEINPPSDEELDKIFENINKEFELKYGKKEGAKNGKENNFEIKALG